MDDTSNLDLAVATGSISASDYDLLTGGTYSDNQDPWTAADDGTLNNSTTGTGYASSAGTASPPANGSAYTPPSWLSQLTGVVGSLGTAANAVNTQVGTIIGGKPAAGPAQAGQPVMGTTFSLGGLSLKSPLVVIGLLAIVGFIFLGRRRA